MYLDEKSYSSRIIQSVKKMLELLFSKEGCYVSYEDFYVKFVNTEGLQSGSPRTKRSRLILRMIHAFEEYNQYPNGVVQRLPLGRMNSYMKLIPEYKAVVDNYKLYASRTEKKQQTIVSEANNASSFFVAMQNQGANSLSAITGIMVQSFFFDGQKVIRGSSYRSNIVAVLKANMHYDTWMECKRILFLIPPIRRSHKNYPYLKKEESDFLLKALDTSSEMSLRDKAIIKLLYYTGIRGVDIANMKMDSIDWMADKINIIQSKTEVPLSLPLRATIGNAIYDYIKMERENNECTTTLFTNKHNPKLKIKAHSIGVIVNRALNKANIRKDGVQKGVRLFRHNLASKLLENGVQTRVISDILGHVSALSLNPYIDADLVHLRECGLSIEPFPIKKEVFDI